MSGRRFDFMSHTLASLDGMMIGVGIAGPHSSGLDASELADLLWRGSKDKTRSGAIPARDFITPAVEESMLGVTRALKQAVQAKARGKDPTTALRKGTEVAQEALIRSIHDYSEVPNAPSTVRRKGKNDPLVNSGELADLVFGQYHAGGKR